MVTCFYSFGRRISLTQRRLRYLGTETATCFHLWLLSLVQSTSLASVYPIHRQRSGCQCKAHWISRNQIKAISLCHAPRKLCRSPAVQLPNWCTPRPDWSWVCSAESGTNIFSLRLRSLRYVFFLTLRGTVLALFRLQKPQCRALLFYPTPHNWVSELHRLWNLYQGCLQSKRLDLPILQAFEKADHKPKPKSNAHATLAFLKCLDLTKALLKLCTLSLQSWIWNFAAFRASISVTITKLNFSKDFETQGQALCCINLLHVIDFGLPHLFMSKNSSCGSFLQQLFHCLTITAKNKQRDKLQT